MRVGPRRTMKNTMATRTTSTRMKSTSWCRTMRLRMQRSTSQVFAELLDQTPGPDGKKRTAYADSAYRSQDRERQLTEEGIESQICEKGTRGHPLTDAQKQSNRSKSRVRARVEHSSPRPVFPNVDTVCIDNSIMVIFKKDFHRTSI